MPDAAKRSTTADPDLALQASFVNVDPEIYVGRGHQRLNDGVIGLAAADLLTAIDLAPAHGIALALAAIAAVRSEQTVLKQKVIDRYRSAAKRLLFDLGEVGK